MQILVAGSVTIGIVLIFSLVARALNTPSTVRTVANQYASPRTLEELQLAQPFSQRALWPTLRGLSRLLTRFAPQQVVQSTRRKLDLAGNPYDLPVLEFLGLRGLSALLVALLFALVFTFVHTSALMVLVLVGAGAVLGFYLPLLWLNLKIRERQADIQMALPDALDLLTVCVEAGMGLDAAMAQVAEKWNNHLSRAFGRTLHELRLGKSRHAVLRDMADRAGVTVLTNFVAALIQAEEHGATIAQTLRVQSKQMRVFRRQRAEERANQMPVKLVLPLVFFIFPPMFIVILGPALLRLLKGFG
ncbi:MAG: type II secretion system F family protein [Chloroflexi bacterium]|nr:type II secretion system F family protein [Chloroflexota bacterium]